DIAAGREVGHDVGRDLVRGAASTQPSRQLGARPRVPREQIGGHEPGPPRVQWSRRPGHGSPLLSTRITPRHGRGASRVYLRAKGLGGASGFLGDSGWAPWFSNVSSPVEKMPRTLRSKSSGLEALSLAVSYAITPSR